MRLILTLSQDASAVPEVQQLIPTVFRSLRRPEAQGFARAFSESLRRVNLVTGSGLYVGQAIASQVDYERLSRIFRKVVRGLFYHETKEKLPCHYGVAIVFLSRMRHAASREEVAAWVNEVRGLMFGSRYREIGRRVFTYRFNFAPGETYRSVWGLTLYGRFRVAAFVEREQLIPAAIS